MAYVLELDLSVARSDAPFSVDASQLYVIQVDNEATFKLEKTNADEIPAVDDLEICACPGEVIRRIFVTNAAGAAGEVLVFNVV